MPLPAWLTDVLVGGSLMGLDKLLNRGGSGQELATFEGEVGPGGISIDPRDLLGQGVGMQGDMIEMILGQLAQGVELPGAYAQQLPVFTGGGLPMPIGVTGVDPALANPARHLSKPGIQYQQGAGGPLDLLGGESGGLRNGPRRDSNRPDRDSGVKAPPNEFDPNNPGGGRVPHAPHPDDPDFAEQSPHPTDGNGPVGWPPSSSGVSLRPFQGQDMRGEAEESDPEAALGAIELLKATAGGR